MADQQQQCTTAKADGHFSYWTAMPQTSTIAPPRGTHLCNDHQGERGLRGQKGERVLQPPKRGDHKRGEQVPALAISEQEPSGP